MGFWVTFMLIVYTLACCFLIFVILIQSGDKGGGLSSLGSSSQGLSDALGATGAEKTLNKMTTIAACLFIVLAVALSYILSGSIESTKSLLPETAPVAPLAGSPSNAVPGGSAASAPPQFEVKSNGGVEVTNPVTIPAAPAGEKLPANPVTAPPSAPAASAPAANPPAANAPAPSAPAPAAK